MAITPSELQDLEWVISNGYATKCIDSDRLLYTVLENGLAVCLAISEPMPSPWPDEIVTLPMIDTIEKVKSLVALLTNTEQVCEWKESDIGTWLSNCGGHAEYLPDNPLRVGMTYCPFCGKRILI
jgi:hypothetical protein